MLAGLCSIATAPGVFAQVYTELTKAEKERIDSLKMSYDADEIRTQQLKDDKQNLSNLKTERSDTKEKAKEARRVERDAYEASRQSSSAYRNEKKAQKVRRQADKQAKKAAKQESFQTIIDFCVVKSLKESNITDRNNSGREPNRPIKRLTVSSIIGDNVFNAEGELLGRIRDVMIEMPSGMIEYVVMEFGGFIGINQKYFAVAFQDLSIDAKCRHAFVLTRHENRLTSSLALTKDTGREQTHINDPRFFPATAVLWVRIQALSIKSLQRNNYCVQITR